MDWTHDVAIPHTGLMPPFPSLTMGLLFLVIIAIFHFTAPNHHSKEN